MREARRGGAVLRLMRGDITTQKVDAVVNAANSSLMGGGGVDGAIHRAGGPAIHQQCLAVVARQGELPPGQAVATTAGDMAAKRVIHTVGPVWYGGRKGEDEVLASAYRASLEVARQEGARTVAFPSVSTGAYGYPLHEAASVAVRAVLDELDAHPASFDEVRFVLFDESTLMAYERVLDDLMREGRE